jgi:hypothetical protein
LFLIIGMMNSDPSKSTSVADNGTAKSAGEAGGTSDTAPPELLVNTKFFSVRPGLDYIYESSTPIPGTNLNPKGRRIRRHNPDGTVTLLFAKSDGITVPYRESDGALEMGVGVEGADGPVIWGRIIPESINEGDTWTDSTVGYSEAWSCTRKFNFVATVDELENYTGNAAIEIQRSRTAGTDVELERNVFLFVEGVGLVLYSSSIPIARGDRLVRTDRLVNIVKSSSTLQSHTSSHTPLSTGTHYSSRPANFDGDKYDVMGDRMIRNLRSAGTLTPGSEKQARKLMDAYRKLD